VLMFSFKIVLYNIIKSQEVKKEKSKFK